MTKKLTGMAVSAAVILMLLSVPAAAKDPALIGFNFLKSSMSTRHAAMGGAGIALADNLYGSQLNPAAIAEIEATTAGFVHQEGIFDTRREFVGFSTPAFGGGLALGLDYFKIADIEGRTGPTEEPSTLFDSQDIAVFASYALALNEKLRAGATARYAAEKIGDQTADAFLMDAGVQFQATPIFSLGAAVRNLGSKPKFFNDEIDLPVTFSGGIAAHFSQTTLSADVALPKESDTRFNLGAERTFGDFLALRAGYKAGYDEEDLAFGVGFMQSVWQVDYAFVPYGSDLGDVHRFALTVAIR